MRCWPTTDSMIYIVVVNHIIKTVNGSSYFVSHQPFDVGWGTIIPIRQI